MVTPPTLRLTQTGSQDNRHTIQLEWIGNGPRQVASAIVDLALTDQDQQDIRWYVEEYAEYPFDPYPARAARVEARMHDIGHELFNGLFASNPRTLRLWGKIAEQLDDMRVEIVTDAEGATALPWELLRDPDTDTVLALHAQSFVRAAPEVPRQALALEQQHIIRILLVICRPEGGDDVPFRSVASRLIKCLSTEARQVFQLDVLRPPTFAQLGQVLREAKAAGKPYHVVHFDGHGVYGMPELLPLDVTNIKYRVGGPQGFVQFESDQANRRELVHGSRLGDLLVQNDVPLLVLNACRSAHAEQRQGDDAAEAAVPAQPAEGDDPYEKVRAFGSLAQQVMLAGVGGVVAMRYNVYVVTAAQFVAELYRALIQGRSLGEAVSRGRKNLHEQPMRDIVEKLTLQDWLVPIVYEAQAMPVFSPPSHELQLAIDIRQAGATPQRGDLDPSLPAEPDVGFFGRDETLLALDRGFDHQHVVLLYAFAGSGKTTVAAEFARWYALTGGVDGPVLWSSFEQRLPLIQVLDQLGRLFDPSLQKSNIQWDALDPAQKRALALNILRQAPVLWIWDNVEPIAGFPAGTPAAWTDAEQRALADFLRAARGTQAKFLLTSRRAEHAWLGDLPMRAELPPMPMHERRQLAEALAAKYGVTLEQAIWRPLLAYSEGNPLTLTVVVGQALREGLRTAQQIGAYVQRLRAGEAIFDDDENEGRSHSLDASLSYGFAAVALMPGERAALALLHHFQGFVDVRALISMRTELILMQNPQLPRRIVAVAGLPYEEAIRLLDRATEVGLLSSLGRGFYHIHPALPWFFRRLYEEYYAVPQATNSRSPTPDPTLAYVKVIGGLGDYYAAEYENGNRNVISRLNDEEANLLHAWRLAQQHSWYQGITSAMQGLRQLYAHTGRRAEWRHLVAQVVPIFVDPATDGPLLGREAQWALVMQYRTELLAAERQWTEVVRLQELVIDYYRRHAVLLLTLPLEQLKGTQRNTLRSLAASLQQLGETQRAQGAAACLDSHQESLELFRKIGEQAGVLACACSLGRTYMGIDIPALRDLAQAEEWYRNALDGWPEDDKLNRAKTHNQLGYIAWQRFQEAREAGQPVKVLTEHLYVAIQTYEESLQQLPPDVVSDLAITHHQLGVMYAEAGMTEQAVAHYREAIRYEEMQGDLYGAAATRENVAIAYAYAGRLDDALLFARAALRSFEQFGPAAATEAERAQQLIATYEQVLQGGA